MTHITVIGSGNMGGALIKGWALAARSQAAPLHITATAHTQQTLDCIHAACPEIDVTLDNVSAVSGADVIVLAVKPWLIADVIAELRPTLEAATHAPLVISVAAGITTSDLRSLLPATVRPVYVMPNIAAEYGESMTFVEDDGAAPTTSAAQEAADLFRHVGEVKVVAPRLMAPGMMMAGCGIAYVMRFVRAMMEGGVEMGLYPADARAVALQTMQGAVSLLQQTGLHPEVAIDKVTTPGGITIRGLNELDHAAFNSAVVRALKAGL